MFYKEQFEVIVIGGGHAGTEAALASARMGVKTLLLTHNIETLGQMSCNPAIGGIGKSHLVREVDAMGGIMALATDKAGIQFRILNARKGPAVRATRAQTDRQLYKMAVRTAIENQSNLTLFQQAVDDLIVENGQVKGVVTNMRVHFSAQKVILTTGTFLGGTIHVGLEKSSGGRAGDPASIRLANRLRELPVRMGRLKTGTPPRIDGKTVNFTQLEEQWGDTPLPIMSFRGSESLHPKQRCCWITHTNEKTHEIIRQSLDRSPMFTGNIEGVGPRYCPSIEDKIHRFADKMSHQIFVEPEGLNTHELYPNGISTSLPFDVQIDLVRSIKGFESAHIMRPGYAIEYDYFDPRDLQSTLETKVIQGLFFAGQINGTTGYEEAASQGLLAGINAALQCQEKPTWSPRRDEAYIGVLVDDLISMGAQEPYRMFTSRAEYRLLLREDNADLRLTEKAREFGLIDESHWRAFNEKKQHISHEMNRLKKHWIQPGSNEAIQYEKYFQEPLSRESNLHDLLKRPELSFVEIQSISGSSLKTDVERQQVETQIKYAGYIARQQDEIDRLKRYENTLIPADFDYSQVKGLSNEVKQKLSTQKPHTLGRAARLQGVTPAAISLLLVYLKKQGSLERVSFG